MDFLKIVYTLLSHKIRYFAKGNPTLLVSVHTHTHTHTHTQKPQKTKAYNRIDTPV